MHSGFRLLVIVAALLAPAIAAQELPFTHFTPGSGIAPLPTASVQKILQDHLGYIWLAFYSSGLSRYDGHSMENYGVQDGLADLTVREIVEDSSHYLWVGSESGLVVSAEPLDRYEPGRRLRFVRAVGNTPLLQSRIRRNCLAVDRAGWVWVGTQGGLTRYRRDADGSLKVGTVASGSAAPTAGTTCLYASGDGSVIAALSDGQTVIFNADGAVKGLLPTTALQPSAFFEKDGQLWIGGVDGAIWRLTNGTPQKISTHLRERIVGFLDGGDGSVWAGSLGSGALRIGAAGDLLVVRGANGLLGDTIWHLLRDREGNIWIGQNGGVSRLRSDYRAFLNYGQTSLVKEPHGPAEPSAFAVLPPNAQVRPWGAWTWIAGSSGLNVIATRGIESALTNEDGLQSHSIYSLGYDALGRLWIGSVAGVDCIAPSTVSPPSLQGSAKRAVMLMGHAATLTGYKLDTTYSIRPAKLADGTDGVWFVGTSGVALLAGGEWFLFRSAAGLPPAGGTSLAADDRGTVWIATPDRGVFASTEPITLRDLRAAVDSSRVINKSFFRGVWSQAQGAPSNSIRSLLWYRDRLWVGSSAGLSVIQSRPLATNVFFGRSTLGGELVVGMAVSPKSGNVWVSQNGGLVEIDAQRLVPLSRVTKAEGLIDDEAWAYGPVACDAGGRVYFATPSGVSIYDPHVATTRTPPPIVRLRQIDLRQPRRGTSNELTIEYAALSYSDETRTRYRTRLFGYDSSWSAEKTDTKIRYTNLPAVLLARDYTFQVIARTGNSGWSAPVSHQLSVLPPAWLRWWAALGYVVLLLALLSLFNRLRTTKLAARNRSLEALISQRTEEIRRQAEAMETMDNIVRLINREVALEDVLKSILEEGRRLFPRADAAVYLRFDHERGRTEVVAVSGYDPSLFAGIYLSRQEAIRRYTERAVQLSEGVYLIRNVTDEFTTLAGASKTRHLPVPQAMLAMAVTLGGRIEGFLVFDNFTDENAFGPADLQMLARLREHAVSAISKADMLHQLQIKNQLAEEANRAKSTFLANMSHELRTPMNAIIGFSEILAERLESKIEPKYLGFLRSILSSGQHLLSIINDILDLSKVEAGRMEIFPERFPVRAAIESVCAVMRGMSARKSLAFTIDIADDVTDIETDLAKFKQVLYNLLSNAVKFSGSGAEIIIRARREISAEIREGLAVSVIDQGIGIPDEHMMRIFDEFHQVDSAMSRQHGGTGLGLALVKKFVELQNGSIEVRSGVNRGSEFTFRLPMKFEGVSIPSPIVQPDGSVIPPGPRVLVVEDEDTSFESLQAYLQSAGYVAVRARTGEEALRLAKTMSPTAVTLDIVLPGMEGWDVLRKLKSDPATADVPVVIVSLVDNRELGLALGADDYFVKPVDWPRLLRRLSVLTARSPRGGRLLVIDDDASVHEMLETELSRQGYSIAKAYNGTEGLEMAQRTLPDVIILDLAMPGVSGFEVAAALREKESTAKIPILIFTAKELTAGERESLRRGVSGLVTKGSSAGSRLISAIRGLNVG